MERAGIQYTDLSDYESHNYVEAFSTRDQPVRRSRPVSEPVTRPGNQLLRSLPQDLFNKLRPALKSVDLAQDDYLFFQDDRPDYVYFPETVVLSEIRTLDDGRTVEVSMTGNEGAVGLSSIHSSRAPNAVQVSQAGAASRIESSEFIKIAKNNPELSHSFDQYMELYIRQISQRAICNMYHTVKQRFCTWLLMTDDRCGKKTLKLTHEQIGGIIGVYRSRVTVIAMEMRKKKIINYSRGGLSIENRGQMEASACGCYLELCS